jgi:hypothetical protein
VLWVRRGIVCQQSLLPVASRHRLRRGWIPGRRCMPVDASGWSVHFTGRVFRVRRRTSAISIEHLLTHQRLGSRLPRWEGTATRRVDKCCSRNRSRPPQPPGHGLSPFPTDGVRDLARRSSRVGENAYEDYMLRRRCGAAGTCETRFSGIAPTHPTGAARVGGNSFHGRGSLFVDVAFVTNPHPSPTKSCARGLDR